MRQSTEKFIKYDDDRDVLIVFGAGASIADGAPLQKDLLRLIFDSHEEKIRESDAAKVVMSFIKENFDLSSGIFPSLESVFGYIDYFLSKKEGLGKNYPTAKIIEIREALIQLIHYVVASSTVERRGVYKHFWEIVATVNRNVSIITMNYDTLLDESFDFLYPDKSYIDYCVEFMNYHHYPEIDAFNWWINPREPVPVWDGGDPKPIKIIKIHGSLNWKYCNCCNQVLLTPWDTQIDLSSMSFKGHIYPSHEHYETAEFELTCPLDGNKFNTFIVPPSYIKDLSHPAINKLLDEAALEIKKAKQIVFVGYSFPEADIHIKALFKKNMYRNIKLHVVDPSLNETIESNYKCLSNDVSFYRVTFEDYISSDLSSLLFKAPNKELKTGK
jgi:hypothetical protein